MLRTGLLLLYVMLAIGVDAATPTADWRLDEKKYDGAPSEVKDAESTHHGTTHNTVVDQYAKVTSGVVCNAIDLTSNGTTDYVAFPKDPFDQIADFTISVWLKSDHSHTSAPYTGYDGTSGVTTDSLQLWIQSGNIYPWLTDSDHDAMALPANFFNNQWHHVVWRRQGHDNDFFIDGTRYDVMTDSAPNHITVNYFYLGQETDNGTSFSSTQDWEGTLDEFLLFREALSDTEIGNIYTHQSAGKNWDGTPRTCPVSADMIINEILYNQNSATKEFVEMFVKSSGTLEGYMIHDQENGNPSILPDVHVNAGEYVVVRKADTDNYTHSGNVHYFDRNSPGFSLNDNGDDVDLYKPSDASDWTTIKSTKYPVFPVDYVGYGSGADSPPSSDNGVQPSWDTGYQSELDGAANGQSISLTPNGVDSDKAGCWELTTSGNAADNGCANYLPTRDTEPGNANLTYSIGQNNNGLPDMHVAKTSIVLDDPVNGGTHPKRIPGATIRYCFTVDNNGTVDATNTVVHDTLDGGNRDKLSYLRAGRGSIVNNTNACTETDCRNLGGTTGGAYDAGTKEVTITMDDPFPHGHHQCAYIETTIN